MEGYCPFNQKMPMILDMCRKWHSDESVMNDEKGWWWVKGEKINKKEREKKGRILSEQRDISDPSMMVDMQSYAVSDVHKIK